MGYQDIEESRMYKLAEEIADGVWEIVIDWSEFAKQALGVQLVRSADSIGANIAESAGRFHPREAINFLLLCARLNQGNPLAFEARHQTQDHNITAV